MTTTTADRAHRIAERMRYHRRRAGMSQEDTAHALGVTTRTYARWERGETLGHLARIDEIARVLDTTPDELVPEEPVTDATLEAKVDRVLELLEGLYGNAGAREALAAALRDDQAE